MVAFKHENDSKSCVTSMLPEAGERGWCMENKDSSLPAGKHGGAIP